MNSKDTVDIDNKVSRKSSWELLGEASLELMYHFSTFWLKDGFQFKEFSILLAIVTPTLFLSFIFVEWISSLWYPLGIVFYGSYLLMLPIYLFLYTRSLYSNQDREKHSEFHLFLVLILSTGFLFGFSQFCRYLFLINGGFSSSASGYWHWVRFGVENLAEALLFDIPSIYDWNLSEIKATTFFTQTILFLVRTLIEFFIVVQIYEGIKNASGKIKPYPTQPYKSYISYGASKLGDLFAFMLWGIPFSLIIEGIIFETILWKQTLNVFIDVAPFILGVWITWINLQALYLVKGKWNKLFSLINLLLGLWLVKQYWSHILILF